MRFPDCPHSHPPYSDIRSMIRFLLLLLLMASAGVSAQDVEQLIAQHQQRLAEMEQEKDSVLSELEKLRLQWIREQMEQLGYPTASQHHEVVRHSAMTLGYAEPHEQAAWVQHMVIPEVEFSRSSRTNDFRVDSLVSTGTAVETDYFLKEVMPDGEMKFDGFGHDRGHLAPSADFRWSPKALSESYYYSNMSPQKPEFNRERWAELEAWVRTYVIDFQEPVVVVTGPVLKEGLPKQGENGVTIPAQYFKVLLDIFGEEKKALAFLMPNDHCAYPVSGYTTTVDEVEKMTGLDLFASLPDALEEELETMNSIEPWIDVENSAYGEVSPIKPPLPKGYFNTLQAKYKVGQKTNICGTVVAASKSRKDAIYLNFDQKYPRNVFYATIWKNNQNNFSYDPEKEFLGERICVYGKVDFYNDQARISVNREEQITLWEEVTGNVE